MSKHRPNVVIGTREYTPEEVLPFAGPKAPEREYDGFRVRMTSLRYQVFARSCACVSCGVEGTVMLLEQEPSDPKHPSDRAHFNLYARTPAGLVMMTKDHFIPRSRGGSDHVANLQTMCFPCNRQKGGHLEEG